MNALRLFVGILCAEVKPVPFFFCSPGFFFRKQVFVFAEGQFQNRGNLRNRGQFPSLAVSLHLLFHIYISHIYISYIYIYTTGFHIKLRCCLKLHSNAETNISWCPVVSLYPTNVVSNNLISSVSAYTHKKKLNVQINSIKQCESIQNEHKNLVQGKSQLTSSVWSSSACSVTISTSCCLPCTVLIDFRLRSISITARNSSLVTSSKTCDYHQSHHEICNTCHQSSYLS